MDGHSLTASTELPARRAWALYLLATPSAVLVSLLLCQWAELLHAEYLLRRAAAAGAQEALLPKATPQSVEAAIARAVRETRLAPVVDRAVITVNGKPVLLSPLELLQSGDQVSVTLGLYANDVAGDALRPLGISMAGRKLLAQHTLIKP